MLLRCGQACAFTAGAPDIELQARPKTPGGLLREAPGAGHRVRRPMLVTHTAAALEPPLLRQAGVDAQQQPGLPARRRPGEVQRSAERNRLGGRELALDQSEPDDAQPRAARAATRGRRPE